MNLIDRYISAVAQQLPEIRRNDITRELKANILDRLENLALEQGRATTAEDESAVLRELGHPCKVAAGFMPPQQLVSAEWFPLFKQCLTYGIIFIFVLQLIGFGIALTSMGKLNIVGFLFGFFQSSLLMFASVTGAFYLLSNLPATDKISPYSCWKPEQLPPLQQSWQKIKTLDSASDFATHVFLLLILQRDLWIPSESLTQLPLQFGPAMQPWIMPLTIWASVFILFNVWNLRFSFWTQSKLVFNIAMNLFGSVAAFLLISVPDKIILVEKAHNPFNNATLEHLNLWILLGIGGFCLFEVLRSGYRIYLLKNT
ncbi:MAG: hypothetical protein V4660_02515 [Pseudomonadota bacterium]